MTLTRIWAAFVLIAFLVGGTRLLNGDQKIFVRMITGKSSDRYDSTFYVSVGNPTHLGLSSNYPTFLAEYGYYPTTQPAQARFLLHDVTISPPSSLSSRLRFFVDSATFCFFFSVVVDAAGVDFFRVEVEVRLVVTADNDFFFLLSAAAAAAAASAFLRWLSR